MSVCLSVFPSNLILKALALSVRALSCPPLDKIKATKFRVPNKSVSFHLKSLFPQLLIKDVERFLLTKINK